MPSVRLDELCPFGRSSLTSPDSRRSAGPWPSRLIPAGLGTGLRNGHAGHARFDAKSRFEPVGEWARAFLATISLAWFG